MKQRFFLLAFFVLASLNAYCAYDFTVGNQGNYKITNDTVEPYTVAFTSVPWQGDWLPARGTIRIPSSVTYNDVTYIVTSIANITAFMCDDVTGVIIPSTVIRIIDNVFNNASNLASVVVEEGNPVYDSRDNCNAIIETATNTLIAGCKKTTFPSTVTRIRTHAFSHNSISSVVIPDNVTVIEEGAFDCCYGLSSVRTGNGITEIAPGAFSSCTALRNLTIGNNVQTIGNGAFYGCTALSSLTIPNSVTTIEDRAFYGCVRLKDVVIPNSVTTIGAAAFADAALCDNGIRTVTLGDNLTTIGGSAFAKDRHLETINIPVSVTKIGGAAFEGCEALAEIDITEGVTTIEKATFRGCIALTTVTLSRNLTAVKSNAFAGCTALASITCSAVTPPVCDESEGAIFTAEAYETAILYVPAQSVGAYREADVWKNFRHIVSNGIGTGIEQTVIQGLRIVDGTVVCTEPFAVYDLNGCDVTTQNGNLKGTFIVRTATAAQKVLLR